MLEWGDGPECRRGDHDCYDDADFGRSRAAGP